MNITQYRTRILSLLGSTGPVSWPDTLLDEAVRQALDGFSLAAPVTRCDTLLVEEDGNDLDLSGLTGLVDLLSVETARDEREPFEGWNFYWDGATPRVLVESAEPIQPGNLLWVIYCTRHTIEGLDNGAVTTVDPRYESLLVRGAAGYAARARALERFSGYEPNAEAAAALERWGRTEVSEFVLDLRAIAQRQASSLPIDVNWNAGV